MLSLNDITPKRKAPSIWSFDSGYGSNTLEDDNSFQVDYPGEPSICQTLPSSTQQPIGLERGGFWNVSVEDRLRLTISQFPIEPVTTKLNVFTTNVCSGTNLRLSAYSEKQDDCVTCQLWDITNPGQNLKCDDCSDKTLFAPEALDPFSEHKISESAVPRLHIPKVSRPKGRSRFENAARCSACEIAALIDPTQPVTCNSCDTSPDLLSPIPLRQPSEVKRSCARRPSKLQQHALRCLQGWLRDNRNNPYPGADTKRSLAIKCGITEKQVNTWFTNARARRLVRPTDRFNRGSEDEGPSASGLSSVASTPIYTVNTPISYGTSFDRRCSDTSNLTANGANPTSPTMSRKGKKKDYGQMSIVTPVEQQSPPIPPLPVIVTPIEQQSPPIPPLPLIAPRMRSEGEQETWQCTFCYQKIAPKSWRRHEETQHRPKRKWTCLLTGPRMIIPSRSDASTSCAFCKARNPSDEHFLQSHRITECMKKSEVDRTFLRPDHLRQHVKNFHKAPLEDTVRDLWKKDGPEKDVVENWVCGFCAQDCKTWDMRETHIARHFKDGMTMADWGEHVDMVFDEFMAEVCGHRFDFSDPIPAGLDEQRSALNDQYDSAFQDDGDMDVDVDVDFDALAAAFIEGGFSEF
ncbi:hypothetical protein EJ02DRAFT_431262 [Clathrospora elynae]|uniref:Homeobox domain-containing protein n=1 Tax=Clathrospora elynae TaxID=706981 RepID=A0A6A5T4S7_9PLEO|nr:hypothetical protein EJ02DRAFT_431262 [Clathrospora elynae]